jgi:hypothetical protein
MEHLVGNGTPVLYIRRTVVNNWVTRLKVITRSAPFSLPHAPLLLISAAGDSQLGSIIKTERVGAAKLVSITLSTLTHGESTLRVSGSLATLH